MEKPDHLLTQHKVRVQQPAGAHFGNLVDALLAGDLAQLQALDLGLGRLPPLAHRRAEEALQWVNTALTNVHRA